MCSDLLPMDAGLTGHALQLSPGQHGAGMQQGMLPLATSSTNVPIPNMRMERSASMESLSLSNIGRSVSMQSLSSIVSSASLQGTPRAVPIANLSAWASSARFSQARLSSMSASTCTSPSPVGGARSPSVSGQRSPGQVRVWILCEF
jgi:hypothetical protein